MPTVRTNDVETYYERRGDGPPVVFVHAAILDHSMWDRQADVLADDYTTVVYDVRGHGRTGGSARRTYSIDLYVDDLDALLRELDLDRPVLCGLSTGGLVAQTYAATHPERLSGLVLADTFTPRILTPGEWFLRRLFLNALIPPVRLLGYERIEKAKVWLAERFFEGVSGDYGNVERLRETGPKMTAHEFAKVIRSVTRFHEAAVDLSAVTTPTLLLYGEKEFPFVKLHAAELAAHLPDVDVDAVPDAGHASNLDNPEYFTAAVRNFLRRAHAVDGAASSDGDPEPGTYHRRGSARGGARRGGAAAGREGREPFGDDVDSGLTPRAPARAHPVPRRHRRRRPRGRRPPGTPRRVRGS